ncbi:TIGR03086 family metal-binding protein [Streptacidiphilus sp. P02-A3a]|uniref:TIGR03086 family metal-binding protein n=1 Tax=Streptacidiphilus sp. P02-A3a TaxID=2704468 RepID=UPI0015F9DB7A|nr:TIGR03086 family metal-binding protein [Streptacidiphilus sp. P02-A3a]QMU71184.1 TIGR03086 family protein [Streptacidiphilus sp. P02-A3a]
MDLLELDRSAVLESVRILESAGPIDWELPTPCPQWTLRQLVEHMAAGHRGFAAATRGEADDLAAWHAHPLPGDPLDGYRESVAAVLEAFAQPGVLVREFTLPEITTRITFPGRVAVGFHLLDYVAHSWDVAAALGARTEPAPELAEAALAIALQVPDDERRLTPDAQFQPSILPPPGTGTFELFLYSIGRDPHWSAPKDPVNSQEDSHVR